MNRVQYRLMVWKSYFDMGLSWTNYFKYIIGFFALASRDVKNTMFFVFFYIIFCFILGWFLYKFGWIKAQQEVMNNHNYFVIEMRKAISEELGKRKI